MENSMTGHLLWSSHRILKIFINHMLICFFMAVFIISESVAAENRGARGGMSLKSTPHTLSKILQQDYELDLFPEQEFDGWYYFWTNGDPLSAQFQESPEVNWLSVSPTTFTSDTCTDVIDVKFSFTAPSSPGVYSTVLQDLNGNWSDMNVVIYVTNTPELDEDVYLELGEGESYTYYDSLYFGGFTNLGCGEIYIPPTSSEVVYTVVPMVDWLTITPSTLTMNVNELKVVEETVTGQAQGSYSCIEIWTAQYFSWPYYTQWNLDVITDIRPSISANIPTEYKLFQNHPNPFNPVTTIRWQLPDGGPVNLSVYNLAGQKVATLVNESQPAGFFSLEFDATKLAGGIYFYQLRAGNYMETRKMIFMP